MTINLHIERLILEGVPLNGGAQSTLRTALQRELANLLAREGLPGISAGAVSHLAGGTISLTTASSPAQIGSQIAQTLHRAVLPSPNSVHLK